MMVSEARQCGRSFRTTRLLSGRTSASASRTRDGSWERALVNHSASLTIWSMRSTSPTIRSGCGKDRTRLQSGTTWVRSTTQPLTIRRIGASCIALLLTSTAVSSNASLNDPPSPSVELINSIRVTSDADRTVTESPANGAY